MKKTAMMCMLALSVEAFGTAALAQEGYPVTVQDAYGTEVTLEKAPESIVSLSPASTEILFAVGAGDQVTGRTDYCNYPAEAADIESIGSYMEPNMELILSKSPDLVLASDYIDEAIRAQLEESGAVVCIISANDLDAIEADVIRVGELTGNAEKAGEVVETMEEELALLQEAVAGEESGKTAFVDLGYFYSAGAGSLLDNAISTIGLENICADEENMWPMLSVESIIEKNPDRYISLYSQLDELMQTAGLEELECLNAEEGFIYIDGMSETGDMLQRPGPRFVEGMTALAELVYPGAFEE